MKKRLTNIHHRQTVALHGRKENSSGVRVDRHRHDLWHQLFTGTMTPHEIVEEINNIWIDPDYKIVVFLEQRRRGMKKKKLEEADWWRLNRNEYSQNITSEEEIEWTYAYGGYVRAKLRTQTDWKYRQCSHAQYALSIGYGLLEEE